MSLTNGQAADENTFNNAFASKQDDNTLNGVQSLENGSSGPNVSNVQQQINDNIDDIAQNAADIATNASNISTNASNISDNTSDIADLRTLTGTVDTDVDLGTFTGTTIPDSSNIKGALQSLETEVELKLNASEKGAANGVATLDGSGLVPVAQLPSSIVGSLNYQGTWNASTNTPTLSSGSGTKGYYFVVSVAGSTSLDGITDWVLGDWAVYNGTAWEKVDNSEAVTSVNSQTGAVVLDTDDVAEAANLYYTEGRVSANTSVAANTAKVSADGSINTHSDVDTTTVTPVLDDVLTWDGSNWVPGEGGSGGGVGGINYITNFDAEVDTTGWATYADAAGIIPVDGTGGSPTVTLTRTTSSPLRGTGSFLLTKDAANRQGEGASYDFTIDSADQAKVLSVSFDYIVASGTFVAGSNTTDSDVIVYLYDVTNSLLIEPSIKKLFSNSSTVSDKYESTFQTSSDSVSYRLIFHCASTSAVAYDLKIDNVLVGPSEYVFGTPITDWSSYTPTFTGFGTVSGVEIQHRRVGDAVELKGKFTSGTSTAVEARMSLPSGLTSASTAKIPTIQNAGPGTYSVAGASSSFVLIEPSVTYVTFGLQNASVAGLTKANGNGLLSSGQSWSFKASIPVEGWSSSVQMSDRADTRVVAFSANTSTTAGTTTNPFRFTNVLSDTHGAYNSTTGQYTIQVSDWYHFSWSVYFNSGNTANLYLNGTVIANGGNVGSAASASSGVLTRYFNAGDVIEIRPDANLTALGGAVLNRFAGFRLSGPSAIAATETIAFSANTSTTAATTSAPFIFTNVLGNTHGMYNSSNGIVTIPARGWYSLTGSVFTAATYTLRVYINAVNTNQLTSTGTAGQPAGGTNLYLLNAGDTVQLRPDANVTATGAAGINYFTMHRVGL